MYSPSANNIGMDLNVPTVRMVNRDAATLVVGDVVVMSTAHTGVVYPPTTRTQEPFSPLASIVKAGSAPFTPGFIGTVARLGPLDGRTNDTVDVVFGGLANAKVAAVTTDVAIGTQLSLSSTTGQLTNDATGRIVAISLGAVTAGQTANIDVILDGEIAADTAALGTFATLSVTATTASTSTTTGAAVIAGGVGIGGALNTGGNAVINGISVGTGTAAAPTSNTVLGSGAGAAMQSTADFNTLIGESAGAGITSGDSNTAVGRLAGGVTTGNDNTAIGRSALASIATGSSCVAVGRSAAALNTASSITAVGANALDANTTGTQNTAVGTGALGANTTGPNNVAVGYSAMAACDTGDSNTAVGTNALGSLIGAASNVAVGRETLIFTTSGNQNVAVGQAGLGGNTTGSNNISIGHRAARFQADGTTSLTDPEGCVYIGTECRGNDNNDSNAVVIAGRTATARGVCDGANTTVIGNAETTSTRIPAGNLTLTNGNFIVGTSGKGIDFSAHSNAAGMTSELLSDYEEGTFTPTVTSGITTPTYTTQLGRYTKVGRMVYFSIHLVINTGTANANQLVYGGLPFTSNAAFTGGCWFANGGGIVALGTNLPTPYVDLGSTTISFNKVDTATFKGTDINAFAGNTIFLCGVYTT